ncbi:MAG: acetoacetate--CoA ligase [Pseudomonadota bacterium]
MEQALWEPREQDVLSANLTRFAAFINERHRLRLTNYHQLHDWSVQAPELFWAGIWAFCDVRASAVGTRILEGREMPGARWFPDAKLNFAENLLRRRDDAPALIFRGEDQRVRTVSFAELYDEVSAFAGALKRSGVQSGDRVAGYLPNMAETVIAMLAASSLGAVWSSCSPDFGVQGVLDRFGQIEPKVLVAADGYFYNGKPIDSLDKLGDIVNALPSVETVVTVSYLAGPDGRVAPTTMRGAVGWSDYVGPHRQEALTFAPLPFDHPLYIMYSSGTTGAPKCIVHGQGGTLLQHLKEHQLQADVRPNDKLFYFTTCGWMMWNWLVSGLASEATLILYDGSPFYPDGNRLFDLADELEIDIFGTSAKFIDSVKKAGLRPRDTHRLDSVRAILSTGSPLVPESFDFVYEGIKTDVRLSSITGGTDIIGCFAQGAATLPVWRGELQCLALGMNVEVWSDDGQPIVEEKGELVCIAPFPSMPIHFWNDSGDEKYRQAYFERFPGVWCHGDYVEITKHRGMVVHGRSDAVLNPGGVRIGTAEIYRQVEQLDEVVEGLVVGQTWEEDTRVVLFVVLRPGLDLDEALTDKIKRQIRANATPRHVPSRIVQVADIPRTKSGKIVELAVREIIHGRPVKNQEALANPEALAHFRDRAELAV